LEFPTISLGESLMKPTTMLYRNLMAMDSVVLIGDCDKLRAAQPGVDVMSLNDHRSALLHRVGSWDLKRLRRAGGTHAARHRPWAHPPPSRCWWRDCVT